MTNDRFDKFTDRARRVLTLAQEEATRFNHNYIGTEHLLLGLVRESDGVAAKVLQSLGVELNRVRSAVEFIIGRGDRMIVSQIGLTPRAKKVIELAVDEARQLGHHYIGTEHLLLGLVREGEGIAAGALESMGVNLDRVRVETVQVLSQGGVDPPAAQASEPPEGVPLPRIAWEYLILQVAYAEAQGSAVVQSVNGAEDVRYGQKPIHEALLLLGAEGWELVAVDRLAGPEQSGSHHYVFKRPA
jgi:ATP-dependent Clp protease ATP-binding subunit ClpA